MLVLVLVPAATGGLLLLLLRALWKNFPLGGAVEVAVAVGVAAEQENADASGTAEAGEGGLLLLLLLADSSRAGDGEIIPLTCEAVPHKTKFVTRVNT